MIEYWIPGTPIPKPTQVHSDKWRKRPIVVEYRQWCDLARKCCPDIPPAESILRLNVTAFFRPPASWSHKKQKKAIGTLKRTKPDASNILKAVEDALWKNDERLGEAFISRVYGVEPGVHLEIILVQVS